VLITKDVCKLLMCLNTGVSWLEFNVPFQHKYGYISDENTGVVTSMCADPAWNPGVTEWTKHQRPGTGRGIYYLLVCDHFTVHYKHHDVCFCQCFETGVWQTGRSSGPWNV